MSGSSWNFGGDLRWVDGQTVTGSVISWRSGLFAAARRAWRSTAMTTAAAARPLRADGIPRGGALGAERMARRLADALPGEHPLRDALWAFLRPMLSPRLAELHRDAFITDAAPQSTVDLDSRHAESDLGALDLGDSTADAA